MTKNVFGLALMLTFFAAASPIQALQDPTKPPGDQRQATTPKPSRALALGSIVHGPDRRVAVIEGVTLTEGQSYNGIRVRRIHRDRVEILDRGQRRVLYPASLPQVRRTQ
ncbi:hypothetical protein [Marinobacter sp. VGCF2001]|uniref:hypothetical protein n=1 Tax=Marinobacter sp. VGCF2001 TaxID=3417189 RepID=UPI003CFA4B0F